MDRQKPLFFDELGHHGDLKQAPTNGASSELPWSLLSPSHCLSENWPPMALPMMTSTTPEDALSQMDFLFDRWGLSGAHVSIMASPNCIDAEGSLETARLLLDADYYPLLRSPLDWSVATRLSEIGCLAIDVQAVDHRHESTVSRPWLLERIIEDSSCPVILSGAFSVVDANFWRAKGASAILHELAP